MVKLSFWSVLNFEMRVRDYGFCILKRLERRSLGRDTGDFHFLFYRLLLFSKAFTMNIYCLIRNKKLKKRKERKNERDTSLILERNGKAVEILLKSLKYKEPRSKK